MTRRAHLRVIRLHFGAFDYSAWVLVGPAKPAEKWLEKYFGVPIHEIPCPPAGRGAYWVRGAQSPVVWLPKAPASPAEYGTLAHELLHLIRGMLVDWAGMPLTSETDEAFCHSMGYAVRTVLAELRKKG